MKREPATPVFVSRQTAAERLEISVDTFDTWVRTGFIPRAHIDKGQIVRWHWPSLESALIAEPEASRVSPFMEALKNVPSGGTRRAKTQR